MTIYFIRHAQSLFNAAFDRDKPDPMIFDAPLSELGKSQAKKAGKNFSDIEINHVIVSPFTRTLQTAHLIFGNTRPMAVNVTVREQLSNSCDVGSHPQVLARNYPHLDFDHLDDHWWHKGEEDHRGIAIEPHEILMVRANQFVDLARKSAMHSTAVVSHGNFIHAITGIHLDNCQIIAFDPVENRVTDLLELPA